MDRALKFLDKDVSSVIEFDEFMRFTEFSWKYVAASNSKHEEPGVRKKSSIFNSVSRVRYESIVEDDEELFQEFKKEVSSNSIIPITSFHEVSKPIHVKMKQIPSNESGFMQKGSDKKVFLHIIFHCSMNS